MSLTAARFFNKWIGAVHLAAIGSAGVKNSFKVLDLEVDRWKSRIYFLQRRTGAHRCTD